jgi:CubicO group peptidase (beta-lactamase class C family)
MFGTPGAGGQMGYADPTYKLGIGYVTNYHGTMPLSNFKNLETVIYDIADKTG